MRLISGLFVFLVLSTFANAEKIREISNIIGVRENPVIGYGLVVGLNGTGDGSSSLFTLRSLSNLLQTVNVKIDPADIKSKNVAAVIVTTNLPAFSRQGDKLDVAISSIGDAKSLEGGTLLMTALKGVDGNIYALSQGALSIGGKNGKGGGEKNHATSGSIFGGGIVEREVVYDIYNQNFANLSLKKTNFSTAIAIQDGLNAFFGEDVAKAIDPRTIRLEKPQDGSMIEFLAKTLEVEVAYQKIEKIIIDEKTGTIVSGVNIKVDPVVITHGDLTIKISPKNTELSPQSVDMKEDVLVGVDENLLQISDGEITVANISRALHKLGATPKDIISILENIKRAGAISAVLEVL